MKSKKKLILILFLIGLTSFTTSKVLGQSVNLPRVTTACESKVGLLVVIDDGFSVLKKCPKNSRKVILGELTEGDGSQQIGAGEIAFLTGSMNHVLKKDGTVWWYDDMDKIWKEDIEKKVFGIEIDNIIQWNVASLLTKDGNIWIPDNGVWVNMGVPGQN